MMSDYGRQTRQWWDAEERVNIGRVIAHTLIGSVMSWSLFIVCFVGFQLLKPLLDPLLNQIWQAASLPISETSELIMHGFQIFCNFLVFHYIVRRSIKKAGRVEFKGNLIACMLISLIPWLFFIATSLISAKQPSSLGPIQIFELVLYLLSFVLAVYVPYKYKQLPLIEAVREHQV
ncbi:hypothetical protein ACFCP7_01420 [Paenibacillus elgii]